MATSFSPNLQRYKNKSPAMRKFLEGISVHKTGCATCGNPTDSRDDFRDDLSRKEYEISGMCQDCQDETFGPDL